MTKQDEQLPGTIPPHEDNFGFYWNVTGTHVFIPFKASEYRDYQEFHTTAQTVSNLARLVEASKTQKDEVSMSNFDDEGLKSQLSKAFPKKQGKTIQLMIDIIKLEKTQPELTRNQQFERLNSVATIGERQFKRVVSYLIDKNFILER